MKRTLESPSGTDRAILGGNRAGLLHVGNGGFEFHITPGTQTTGGVISDMTMPMFIRFDGNVGIGTTSPAYPLDISGTGITALRINGTVGNPNSNNTQLRFAGGKNGELWAIGPDVATNNGSKDFTFWALGGVGAMMTLQNSTGNVGIGTISPQHKLSVNGIVGAKEVIVTNTGWPDYVFRPEYRLQPLSEVKQYIQEHHHLPDVPSEAEVGQNGVGVGEMQAKLLAKVEELTLHMIRADGRNSRLEEQNRELRERIESLENGAGSNIAAADTPK